MKKENPEESFMMLALDSIKRYDRLVDTGKIKKLLDRYLRTRDERMRTFIRSRIVNIVIGLRQKFPGQELIEAAPDFMDTAEGIEIGDLSLGGNSSVRFRLTKDDFNKNILVIGSVGHGKTSLIFSMLRKLHDAGTDFIVFDSKRDYPSLAMCDNTIYFNRDNLRINPLEPPKGVPFEEWAVHFADLFSHSFALLIGSRDFLLESLLKFYRHSGLEKPALQDYLDYLESSTERNDYIKVVRGRISALLSSSSVFGSRDALDISSLDHYSLVVSIERLGMAEQSFLVSFFLYYFFFMNINSPSVRGRLSKVIAIDDAHRVLDVNKERDSAMGLPLLHSMIAKMRELGIGFIFSDQQLSSVLSSAIQNTNTKLIGRVNLLSDLNMVFGKNYTAQTESVITSLKPKEFLLVSDRIRPYGILKADEVMIDKNIDEDSLLAGDMRFGTLLPINSQEENSLERRFLSEISKEPFVNIISHSKNLERLMSKEDFDFIRRKLYDEGVIGELRIKMQDGKTWKFLYITNKDDAHPTTYNSFGRDSFAKGVLRSLAASKLKAMNVRFEEDEYGFLVRDKMVYITFMDDGSGLAKISESPFKAIIDIVDDDADTLSITATVLKSIKNEMSTDFSKIKVCRFCDFML